MGEPFKISVAVFGFLEWSALYPARLGIRLWVFVVVLVREVDCDCGVLFDLAERSQDCLTRGYSTHYPPVQVGYGTSQLLCELSKPTSQ